MTEIRNRLLFIVFLLAGSLAPHLSFFILKPLGLGAKSLAGGLQQQQQNSKPRLIGGFSLAKHRDVAIRPFAPTQSHDILSKTARAAKNPTPHVSNDFFRDLIAADQVAPRLKISRSGSSRGYYASRLRIEKLLQDLEFEHDITIIHAAEVGEREWSLKPSTPNSLLDVHFVYMRRNVSSYGPFFRPTHYTTGDRLCGRSPDGIHDWCGYDVDVALKQALGMRPQLVELLYSRTVYRRDAQLAFADRVRELIGQANNQNAVVALLTNYRQTAYNNYKMYVENERRVPFGDYLLGVARPMAMAEWLALKYCTPAYEDNKKKLSLSPSTLVIENNFNTVLAELRRSVESNYQAAAGQRLEAYVSVQELVERWRREAPESYDDTVARVKAVDEWIVRCVEEAVYSVYRVRGQMRPYDEMADEFERLYEQLIMLKSSEYEQEADDDLDVDF